MARHTRGKVLKDVRQILDVDYAVSIHVSTRIESGLTVSRAESRLDDANVGTINLAVAIDVAEGRGP